MLDEPTPQEKQEYLEDISHYIRGVRRQLGYTRLQLAAALKLPIDLIIRVENVEEDIATATRVFNNVQQLYKTQSG